MANQKGIAFPVGAFFTGVQTALRCAGLERPEWEDDLAVGRSPLDYSARARQQRLAETMQRFEKGRLFREHDPKVRLIVRSKINSRES